jgi:hypothetical protein
MISKEEVKSNKYYKLQNKHSIDSCIAYAYNWPERKLSDGITDDPNFGKLVFGFNIADGGGYLPLQNVSDSTTITELEFSEAL